ncbi:MAG TPA: Isoquinoline 1-oxidoreductase subunit, partial [Xanthobacteraceae bacterium]
MIPLAASALNESGPDSLAAPESFAALDDTAARSAAMFTELGKVLTYPRCLNCHPAGDRPRQGEQSRLHQPPVERGSDDRGLAAM